MEAAATSTRRGLRGVVGTFKGRVLVLSALCIAVPLLAAWVTGSIHQPHNDDWAFFRILFDYADTGQIHLVGWNEMMLIGHVVAATPLVKLFHHNFAVVNTFEALVSGIGLVTLGFIARRFLSPVYALLVVVIVATFPPFAAVVATFMTDNMAFTLQMLCIATGLAGIRAEGPERHYLVASSLILGIFGFSVREFAVIAPLAVIVGYALAQRHARKTLLWPFLGLVGVLSAAAALYAMRHGLGEASSYSFHRPGTSQLVSASQALFGVALAVAPALLIALRGRAQLGSQIGAASIGAMMLGLFAIQKTAFSPTCCFNGQGSVFLGNLVTERGPMGNQVLFGDRPILFPPPLWVFLSAAAMVAGAALVVLGLKRLRRPNLRALVADPPTATLAAFGVGTVVAITLRALLGGPVFDRYLTVPIAMVAIFLLKGRPDPGSLREARAPLAALVGLILLGVLVVTSGAAFDAARWRAGEAAVATGIPAGDVDAGFEWVGYHYGGVAHEAVARRSAPTPPGYMDMFLGAGNCGLVAATPQTGPDFVLIGEFSYRQFFGLSQQRVFAYRYAPGCAAAGLPSE